MTIFTHLNTTCPKYIQYTGTVREDDLFNALNNSDTKLYIEDVEVDFYPEKLNANFSYYENWSPEVK